VVEGEVRIVCGYGPVLRYDKQAEINANRQNIPSLNTLFCWMGCRRP